MSARRNGASRVGGTDARYSLAAVRILVGLVVLVVVLVLLDRVAAVVTERRLGSRIQTAEDLESRPDVKIHGFPFLTQVLRGSYRDVDLRSKAPISAGGIRIDQAQATLSSVRVSASDALHGTVPNLPVESGVGSAVIPYSSLDAAVKKYGGTAGSLVTVTGDGPGGARLVGPLGLSVGITAHVSDGKLVIAPSAADLDALPTQVSSVVGDALSAPLPLPPFPFNVRLASGSFESDGLHLSARSHDSTFPVR